MPGDRQKDPAFERRAVLGCRVEWEGRPGATFSPPGSGGVIPAGHKQAAGVFMDIKFCQLIAQD